MVRKSKNISKKSVIAGILFLIGLGMSSYSFISSFIERQEQKETLATYKETVEQKDHSYLEQALEDAKTYNDMLYQSKGLAIDDPILSEESYNNLLNLSENGLIGSIEIPKISVDLPIYHGTSEEVLSTGTGHLQGTSLPIGGSNTHSVITGHRGLPNSKLFTRLDELETGDLFYIQVCGETLAYIVNDIQVIEPEDVNCLKIQQGRDLVSLVTCTPYGINSHRLVVTGERITYVESEHLNIEPEMASVREIILTVLPFAFLAIAVVVGRKQKKITGKERK